MGRAVPLDLLRHDLLMMKRHNLNSIRTCHQPSDSRLYDLADELGLWVMDEADLECHGYDVVQQRSLSRTERMLDPHERQELSYLRAGRWLSHNLDWQEAYVDRARQMVCRDVNHPSVVLWSLGNEAFQGRNFQAMYDWIKSYDPSRPVHYEGDSDARIVDVVSMMYPPLSKVQNFAENWDGKKPLLLCEFVHAMGNGPGNIREYIDLFHMYPCLQGGWIWEWANHGLCTKTYDGVEFYGYGGDFGETLHDGHYNMDGVLDSEHQPGPALLEYQKALEPVQLVEGSKLDSVRIVNRYDFIDLGHLKCAYKIVGDGFSAAGTPLMLPHVLPGETALISLPALPLDKLSKNKDSFLEISFAHKHDSPWCKTGDEVAWFQLPIAVNSPSPKDKPMMTEGPAVTIERIGQIALEITSPEASWTFDLVRGRIEAWSTSSTNILRRGPEISIYRVPTDNDISAGRDWKEKEVKHAKPHTRHVTWTTAASDGTAQIRCVQRLAPVALEWSFETITSYTFIGARVTIHVTGDPRGLNLPKTLPRLGLTLSLAPEFTSATWFGRGPGESYRDKKHAQRFGRFSCAIDKLAPKYEYPQESGNHTETRWVEFKAPDTGVSLRASFVNRPDGFDFQASHFDALDVEKARHMYELESYRRDEVIVRLDAEHHGLGSESCEDGYERFVPPGLSAVVPSSQLLPPMVLCEELIGLYFRYIHVSFHTLFHEPSFRTAFRSGTLPKILLFAVFGMSARFSQHETLASIPPRERGRPFTKEAERLLNLHDVSLTTIQACLLLGASAVAEGGGAIESVFFSIACRMGLLLDLPNAPVATQIQQEVNYRVWWTLYETDTWSSIANQLPKMIPLRNIPLPMPEKWFLELSDTAMPDESPFQECTLSDFPLAIAPLGSFAAYSVILNQIFPKIDQANAQSVSDKVSQIDLIQVVEEASHDLDRWASALPSNMVSTPQNLSYWVENGLGNVFVILHMNYHHLCQLLFYQFLHGSTNQKNHVQLTSHYAQKCRQHATQLCDLIQLASQTPGAELLNSFVGHVLTIASTIQLHVLLFSEDDGETRNARRLLERNFELLMNLKMYWPCVDLSFSRFNAFHQACLRSQDDSQFRMDRWMLKFMLEFAAPLAERVKDEDIEGILQRPWSQISRAP
ncbi:hypothetical protein TrVFT333_002446 [Trichoderma virens FT-333]|nr:hypothetical protein TrVFT333_002446 [Trichoderma virens FT-333]